MTPYSTDPHNNQLFALFDWRFPPGANVKPGPPHDTEHGTPFTWVAKLSSEGRSVLAAAGDGKYYAYFSETPIWDAWVAAAIQAHAGEWFVENVRWNTTTAYTKLTRQWSVRLNTLGFRNI